MSILNNTNCNSKKFIKPYAHNICFVNVRKALKILEKEVDEGEIYYVKSKIGKITIRDSKIYSIKESIVEGYSIRVILDKKLGFSYSNYLDNDLLSKAIKTAKISEIDEDLSLPQRQEYEKIDNYDEKIENAYEYALNGAKICIDVCNDENVDLTSGSVSWSYSTVEIFNTNGIEAKCKESEIYCYINTVKDHSTGFSMDISTKLSLDFEGVAREASFLAKSSKNPIKIDTLKTNVILKPIAVQELLEYTLIPNFSGENIYRKRSFLYDKMGEKVFSEELTIFDDGTLEDGLFTRSFDDEGVRTKKKTLVDRGTVEGFLFDTFYARKMDTESTGNAFRSSFSSLPKIEPSNIVIKCDISSISSDDDVFVVYGLIGAHTSNPISGDFSVETRNAFYKGKPIKKSIISGNIFELLNSISGFGKDYKQYSNILSPSIEFEDVTIVG